MTQSAVKTPNTIPSAIQRAPLSSRPQAAEAAAPEPSAKVTMP
jgi:hypothetical protein